jgi:predicted peptidase
MAVCLKQKNMVTEKLTLGSVPVIVCRPNSFDKTKKYSVWLALHGLGEMYSKLETDLFYRVANNGNFSNLLKFADQLGFIIVCPVLVQPNNDWIPGWTDKYLYPVYDYILSNPNTDLDHIVDTGLSLGGGGSLVVATGKFAPHIAAVVPICATPQYNCDFSAISKYSIPVWAFHAKDDTQVSYAHTINQIAQMKVFNPNPAPKMTIYDSGGHSIWGKTYGDAGMYNWALAQKNAFTSVPPPAPIPPEPFKPSHKIHRADGSIESVRIETL